MNNNTTPDEKIQKVLARAGIASRREIERWITDKRIKVNGKLATLGDRIGDSDKVLVDGKPFYIKKSTPRRRVLVYHKPTGEICSRSDPEHKETVFDSLPRLSNGRWVAIGRLDINTSGLLLFTTDGELAHRLMHPSYEIEREYAVRIMGEVTKENIVTLTSGVDLDGEQARFEQVIDKGGKGVNHWYHVILKEGKNREVRRLWESQELTVSRLMRVRFGPVSLEKKIKPGRWEYLEKKDLDKLLALVDLESTDKDISKYTGKRRRS